MSSRKTAIASSVSLVLLAAGQAHAGTSGSVALTSDYLFRGVSQTNEEPAVQGGVEYAADGGFYVGAWGSSVSWLSDLSSDAAPISSDVELDGYLGYRGKFGDSKFGYDVGALYYWYPGDYPAGFNSADTGEIYVGISASPSDAVALAAKYSYAVTDLFGYADSDGSGYLDISMNWQFTPGWTLNVHGGKQWVENNEAYEYADWKLGVTKAFDNGFSIAAAYTDTDAEQALYTNAFGNEIADGRFSLTFAKAF
ncbi:TorF family putative porin [Luteimonas sp. SX5]|uniref:TorF family putative porin n=1 Tax=Luteimonas galliterrae TaxID=2940486 RepID=A0ABT0MLR4_9GAMM|nr:TorF family putative porin [Luteimonas galliterrae]MCL1635829.1 TorF family putative porin [Luteimonas galliterrae]